MRPKFFSQDALVKTFAVVATFIVVYTAAVQVIQWGGLTGQISPSSSSQRSAYLDSAGGGDTSSAASSVASSQSSRKAQLNCNICFYMMSVPPVNCASATTDTACQALAGPKGYFCSWDYINDKCTGYLSACNAWFQSLPLAPPPRKDLTVPLPDPYLMPAAMLALAPQISKCTSMNVDYKGHSNSYRCNALAQSAEVCLWAAPDCDTARFTNSGCSTFQDLNTAMNYAKRLKLMLQLYNPNAKVTLTANQAPSVGASCTTLTSIDVDCSANPPNLTLPPCGFASNDPALSECPLIGKGKAACDLNGKTEWEACCLNIQAKGLKGIWKQDPPGCN